MHKYSNGGVPAPGDLVTHNFDAERAGVGVVDEIVYSGLAIRWSGEQIRRGHYADELELQVAA